MLEHRNKKSWGIKTSWGFIIVGWGGQHGRAKEGEKKRNKNKDQDWRKFSEVKLHGPLKTNQN